MAGKIHPNWVEMNCRVKMQAYHLSTPEQAAFENAPIEVVFSETFLNAIKKDLDRSDRKIIDLAKRIREALEPTSIWTMRDVRSRYKNELLETRGLGASSCALVLDVLMLFGYKLKDVDRSLRPHVDNKAEEAVTLLEMLGMR